MHAHPAPILSRTSSMKRDMAGDYAILAWCLILIFSFLFARLFARLSVAWPGDGGLAVAVRRAYGPELERLAARFQILAVCVGPVAVLSTAGEFISGWIHGETSWRLVYGLLLLVGGLWILTRKLSQVGRISLLLSTAAAGILLAGSLRAVPFYREGPLLATSFDAGSFGYGVLLLFWVLVGWEIVGNYSLEVRDRERTIPRAVGLSVAVVALVSLATAASIQWIDPARGHPLRLVSVLHPLLGAWTVPVITLVTAGLCVSTYLLVMGGTSRLIAAQAEDVPRLRFLTRRTAKGVPLPAALSLTVVHLAVFAVTGPGWADLADLVAVANAFFIGNALCGILAAFRLFPERGTRGVCLLLTAAFLGLLAFSPPWVWAAVLILSARPVFRAIRVGTEPRKETFDACEHPHPAGKLP